MEHRAVGKVVHYYKKLGVALLLLEDTLRVGERIAIVGSTTELEQVVESMQLEHEEILSASPGDLVGLEVVDRVRARDTVYRLS